MKTVGFIGGYDKIDLVLYIARILTIAKKKVLLIDATQNQKAKYIVPTITPTTTYVTDFEGFDVAVGFKDIESVKQYMGIGKKTLDYDVVLMDIDNQDKFVSFNAAANEKNCFVTAFDLYSLKKGLEILNKLEKPIKLTKVYFAPDMLKEQDDYLEYLALGFKIKWDKDIYNFPIELGNYSVIIENQIISKIKLKGVSEYYKQSLQFLMQMLFAEDLSNKELEKAFRILEKE